MDNISLIQTIVLAIQIPSLIFGIVVAVRCHKQLKETEKIYDYYICDDKKDKTYSARYDLINKNLFFVPNDMPEHYGDCNYCKRCPDGMTVDPNTKLLCHPCK